MQISIHQESHSNSNYFLNSPTTNQIPITGHRSYYPIDFSIQQSTQYFPLPLDLTNQNNQQSYCEKNNCATNRLSKSIQNNQQKNMLSNIGRAICQSPDSQHQYQNQNSNVTHNQQLRLLQFNDIVNQSQKIEEETEEESQSDKNNKGGANQNKVSLSPSLTNSNNSRAFNFQISPSSTNNMIYSSQTSQPLQQYFQSQKQINNSQSQQLLQQYQQQQQIGFLSSQESYLLQFPQKQSHQQKQNTSNQPQYKLSPLHKTQYGSSQPSESLIKSNTQNIQQQQILGTLSGTNTFQNKIELVQEALAVLKQRQGVGNSAQGPTKSGVRFSQHQKIVDNINDSKEESRTNSMSHKQLSNKVDTNLGRAKGNSKSLERINIEPSLMKESDKLINNISSVLINNMGGKPIGLLRGICKSRGRSQEKSPQKQRDSVSRNEENNSPNNKEGKKKTMQDSFQLLKSSNQNEVFDKERRVKTEEFAKMPETETKMETETFYIRKTYKDQDSNGFEYKNGIKNDNPILKDIKQDINKLSKHSDIKLNEEQLSVNKYTQPTIQNKCNLNQKNNHYHSNTTSAALLSAIPKPQMYEKLKNSFETEKVKISGASNSMTSYLNNLNQAYLSFSSQDYKLNLNYPQFPIHKSKIDNEQATSFNLSTQLSSQPQTSDQYTESNSLNKGIHNHQKYSLNLPSSNDTGVYSNTPIDKKQKNGKSNSYSSQSPRHKRSEYLNLLSQKYDSESRKIKQPKPDETPIEQSFSDSSITFNYNDCQDNLYLSNPSSSSTPHQNFQNMSSHHKRDLKLSDLSQHEDLSSNIEHNKAVIQTTNYTRETDNIRKQLFDNQTTQENQPNLNNNNNNYMYINNIQIERQSPSNSSLPPKPISPNNQERNPRTIISYQNHHPLFTLKQITTDEDTISSISPNSTPHKQSQFKTSSNKLIHFSPVNCSPKYLNQAKQILQNSPQNQKSQIMYPPLSYNSTFLQQEQIPPEQFNYNHKQIPNHSSYSVPKNQIPLQSMNNLPKKKEYEKYLSTKGQFSNNQINNNTENIQPHYAHNDKGGQQGEIKRNNEGELNSIIKNNYNFSNYINEQKHNLREQKIEKYQQNILIQEEQKVMSQQTKYKISSDQSEERRKLKVWIEQENQRRLEEKREKQQKHEGDNKKKTNQDRQRSKNKNQDIHSNNINKLQSKEDKPPNESSSKEAQRGKQLTLINYAIEVIRQGSKKNNSQKKLEQDKSLNQREGRRSHSGKEKKKY